MTVILSLVRHIKPWQLSLATVLVACILAVAVSHLFWQWHTGAIPDGLTVVAGGAALIVALPMVIVFVAAVYELQNSNRQLAVTRDALSTLNRHLESRVDERTAALSEARDAAERANAAKSVFLANMSHELRTPLNGIIGYAEMIVHRETLFAGVSARKLDEYAAAIHSSGKHLNAMVGDLLDLSKIEFGQYDVAPAPTCIATVLGETVDALTGAALARGQRIDLTVPAALPPLTIDGRALRQIVTNLVSNALKYSDDGQAVTVEAAWDGDRIAVSVADRGIGMSAEAIALATEPFSKFSDAHIAAGQSIGLGLSIVNRLCGLLGGSLALESGDGAGTTARVALPAPEARVEPVAMAG